MKTHIVGPHDTLIGILKQLGMAPGLSKALARYNGISNENLIYRDQLIKVPDQATLTRWAKQADGGPQAPAAGGKTGHPVSTGGDKPGPAGSAAGQSQGSAPKAVTAHLPPKKAPTPSRAPTQTQKFVESLKASELREILHDGRLILVYGYHSATGKHSRLPRLSHPELLQFMRVAEQQAFDRKLWGDGELIYTEASYPVRGTEPERDGVRLTRDQLNAIQMKGLSD